MEIVSEASTNNRIPFIDIARGIAMLCIIAGHFGIISINRIVYTFHVPLFFVLSGFVYSKKADSLGERIKGNVLKTIVPYLLGCFGIMLFTVLWFFILGIGADIPQRIIHIIRAMLWGAGTPHEAYDVVQIGALWFLPALFTANLVLRCALHCKYPSIIVILAMFLAIFSNRYIWLPASIQPGLFASFYLYIGYCGRKTFDRYGLSRILFIVSLAIWFVAIFFNVSLNLVDLSLGPNPLFSILSSLAGSYAVIYGSMLMEKHGRILSGILPRFLNLFGQVTLPVLLFHAIADFTFPWYLLYGALSNLGLIRCGQHLCILILNIMWPLLGVWLISKTTIARSILLPRKLNTLEAS